MKILFILLAILVAALPDRVVAQELPIRGAFGITAQEGCKSLREETEGAYLVIDDDGKSYGAGGECGCTMTSIKKTGASTYQFSCKSRCVEQTESQDITSKLEVLSPDKIVLDGEIYDRCAP